MTATATEEKNETGQAAGRVARVIGPVVDVEFPSDAIPEMYNALTVEVTIADQAGGYLVRVVDDGVGMPATVSGTVPAHDAKPGHLGVILMRERAEFSGGWFRLDSAVGSGTTVSVWVPHGADLENRPRPPALRPGSGSPRIQALWDAWEKLCDEEGGDR